MLASQRLVDREPSARGDQKRLPMSSRGDPSIGQKDTGAEARGKETHTFQKTMLNINIRSFENPGKSSQKNDFTRQ